MTGQTGYVAIAEDEARASLQAIGLPSDRVERLIGFYRLVRDVEHVLDRPAIPFARFAADYAHCWQ